MIMDVSISSLTELYERLKPALISKKEEMKRLGYPYIKEEDIWNYLKDKGYNPYARPCRIHRAGGYTTPL